MYVFRVVYYFVQKIGKIFNLTSKTGVRNLEGNVWSRSNCASKSYFVWRDKKRLGIQEVTLFGIKLKIVRFSESIQVIFQS